MSHERFHSCIEACNQCALACDHCASACLAEANPKPMARCIALDIDCAEICRLAAGYMARGSELAAAVCQACAEVCAEACRRCAQECRRMADMSAGGRKDQSHHAGH